VVVCEDVASAAIMHHEFNCEFNGGPAGRLDESKRRNTSPTYRYIPYRSIAHYELECALREDKHPRCTFSLHPRISSAVRPKPNRDREGQ
jgi:hypothetical protein